MGAVLTDEATLPGLGIGGNPNTAPGTFLDGPASVVIPGIPKPWRRTGYNPHTGRRFVTRKDLAEREPVGAAWAHNCPTFGGEPVALTVEFVFPRPKSHFGTGRNAHLVKASAARFPGKNLGDLDNLVKLVKDALNAIAFDDDSQVVQTSATKRWAAVGEQSHTSIQIRRA